MIETIQQKGKTVQGHLPFINPATGEQFGQIQTSNPDEVNAAVAEMKAAARTWGKKPLRERIRVMKQLHQLLFDEIDQLTAIITQDTGKPRQEALIEVFTSLNYFSTLLKRAPQWLKDEKVSTGLQFFKKAWIQQKPYGVVAVIAPWNYPFILTINPILGALISGNTVVAKGSEVTPAVASLMETLFQRIPELKAYIRFVYGGGEVGAALVAAAPDLIYVTGSVETGRKISEAAAKNLTPVVCELGGKDPMIVLADADLESAARWGVWGAFSNSGQTCMAPERVYVVEAVYEPFLQAVKKEVETLRVGYSFETEAENNYGSMTSPNQLKIVSDYVADAIEKDAHILCGGDHEAMFHEPTLVIDINDKMKLMQEETFGPVMPVIKVRDAQEAIRRANDSPYGLSASVFGEDISQAKQVAEALEVGTVNINDTLTHYGIPELPFGGVKRSGNGRSNGKAGLLEFTQPIGYVSGKPKSFDIATIIRKPGNYHIAKGALLALLAPSFRQKWAGVKALLGR